MYVVVMVAAVLERIVPPADKTVAAWHVSPFVDLVAYQFSWLWILIPLALSGDHYPKDYIALFAAGMTISLVHRFYTLPYVYLDKQIFKQHITRFTLFFFLLNLGSIASAFLYAWKAPANFFEPVDVALALSAAALVVQCVVADKRAHTFSITALVVAGAPFLVAVVLGLAGAFTASSTSHELCAIAIALLMAAASAFVARETKLWLFFVVAVVATLIGVVTVVTGALPALNEKKVKGSSIIGFVGVVAALWNLWHTLMQKFGIMRMYAAKSSVPVDKRTPAWVDRFFLFGSLPLFFVVVGPSQRHFIAQQSKSITQYLMPALDGLAVVSPYVTPIAALVAGASIVLFVRAEWRADRCRCWPRLSMAIALLMLNASFLVVSPVKVYIAYGFSHAVEYMVFVWAFLRRRYAHPLPHEPLLQRALRHPALAYLAYTAAIGGVYFIADYGRQFHLIQFSGRIFDVTIGTWLFSFAIWQSLAHFYFDGFLWKMRLPAVRASI